MISDLNSGAAYLNWFIFRTFTHDSKRIIDHDRCIYSE